MSGGDYSIPSELQETLLDFTVHYLVERPPDIIDFAMEYFSELQSKRNSAGMVNSEDEEMQSEDEDLDGEQKHTRPMINDWWCDACNILEYQSDQIRPNMKTPWIQLGMDQFVWWLIVTKFKCERKV